MKFRNRVKALRLERGLSVAALARKAEVSEPTVFEIERDNGYEPRVSVVTKIAEALGAPDAFWLEADDVAADEGV